MTQEPKPEDKPTTSTAEPKLLIDRPSDFRFHAAYLVYSDAWDKTASEEVKKKLNELIESLSKEAIEYENFYASIGQYRVEFNPEHFVGGPHSSRVRIETERKRDWRRKEEAARRNQRHGR